MTQLIDGRGMQPPEPLQLTIDALETLAMGEELQLLLYCSPQPLYAILRRDGYRWREELRDDGTFAINICRHIA